MLHWWNFYSWNTLVIRNLIASHWWAPDRSSLSSKFASLSTTRSTCCLRSISRSSKQCSRSYDDWTSSLICLKVIWLISFWIWTFVNSGALITFDEANYNFIFYCPLAVEFIFKSSGFKSLPLRVIYGVDAGGEGGEGGEGGKGGEGGDWASLAGYSVYVS